MISLENISIFYKRNGKLITFMQMVSGPFSTEFQTRYMQCRKQIKIRGKGLFLSLQQENQAPPPFLSCSNAYKSSDFIKLQILYIFKFLMIFQNINVINFQYQASAFQYFSTLIVIFNTVPHNTFFFYGTLHVCYEIYIFSNKELLTKGCPAAPC